MHLLAMLARTNHLWVCLILALLLPPCRSTMGQRELRDAFQRVYGAATQVRTCDAIPSFVWCINAGRTSSFRFWCVVGWRLPP